MSDKMFHWALSYLYLLQGLIIFSNYYTQLEQQVREDFVLLHMLVRDVCSELPALLLNNFFLIFESSRRLEVIKS